MCFFKNVGINVQTYKQGQTYPIGSVIKYVGVETPLNLDETFLYMVMSGDELGKHRCTGHCVFDNVCGDDLEYKYVCPCGKRDNGLDVDTWFKRID